jgi:hypothetical protein
MAEDAAGPDFVEEDDAPPDETQRKNFSQAVLYASDWTVETVVSQLARGNIELNPDFQRRDAWSSRNKSRFIKSIVLGLPIPQIVLAERNNQRGRYIVLDGKQRLLSLLQFTGKFEGEQNAFRLSGLEVRTDITRRQFKHFENKPELQDDLNAFLNHTIRTVVIRNWPGMEFLHLVFLRLNTGSLKLSPQELRQALIPGPFSTYVDKAASESAGLKTVLSRDTPDPRMRDVELLVRYLSFRNFLNDYNGRMKAFLDKSCERLNNSWQDMESIVRQQVNDFEQGIVCLLDIFGPSRIARKFSSQSFNRAVFDALIFYASIPKIAEAMRSNHEAVGTAYDSAMADPGFLLAVESDTAGIPHTFERLTYWGEHLSEAVGLQFGRPVIVETKGEPLERRIRFSGFW